MTIAQIDISNGSVAVKKVVHVYQYTCCTFRKSWYICKSNKSLGNSLAYLNLCGYYAVRCPMLKEDHFSFVTLQNARAGFIYGCFLAGRCWSSELLKLTSWKSSQFTFHFRNDANIIKYFQKVWHEMKGIFLPILPLCSPIFRHSQLSNQSQINYFWKDIQIQVAKLQPSCCSNLRNIYSYI